MGCTQIEKDRGGPDLWADDSALWRDALDGLEDVAAITQAAVTTFWPSGGLRIIHTLRAAAPFVRAYALRLHREDRLSWEALRRWRAVGEVSINGRPVKKDETEREDFRHGKWGYRAAAPLLDPIFGGFPGVLLVWRDQSFGPFTELELQSLNAHVNVLEQRLRQRSRPQVEVGDSFPGTPKRARRLFIFDSRGAEIEFGPACAGSEDAPMREALRLQALQWLESTRACAAVQRVRLSDLHGELRNIGMMSYERYAALGEGAVVFFMLPPLPSEWPMLRSRDVQADSDLARLVPSLRYIHRHFMESPSLKQIARQAHLSPFHFHRQFTESFGLTPKQLLLERQIDCAKRRLLEGDDMARVARECGFSHQSHFTSRFKQAVGLTPTQWRRARL